MGTVRKFKTFITILVILILILYISATTGLIIALLTTSSTAQLVLVQLSEYFKYIGFQFNTSLALLVIPASILLILNNKIIDIDKRYMICQILSFISFLIIMLSLIIPFLVYLFWLEDQPGVDIQVWGTIIPIFIIYPIEMILIIIVFILLIIKRE